MNLINRYHLVSCSTQTHSKKNIKSLINNKNTSLKNIKIDEPQCNIKTNIRISSNLKGKKIINKRKIIEIYNSIYNNYIFSKDKDDNSKKNIVNENHKKGEISLSFEGNDSKNQIVLHKLDFTKSNNLRTFKKIPNNNEKKNDNCKYPLLSKKKCELLPIYNVRKILKNHNNSLLSRNNGNDNFYNYEKTNINSKNEYNEDFPTITKRNKNTGTFDSTDIKKENDKIIKDLFSKNCLNRIKINKKIIKINVFNKNMFSHNHSRQINNRLFIQKRILDNNYTKIPSEIRAIKKKVKKLYNHNRTSCNMILSNEY